jgi:hypothetical protein
MAIDLMERSSYEQFGDITGTLAGYAPGFEFCPSEGKGRDFTFGGNNRGNVKLPMKEPYPGTIFRLPLRNDKLARQSDIKPGKSFTDADCMDILRTFQWPYTGRTSAW